MKFARKTAAEPRRTPTQARAQKTIESIFEAVYDVLCEHGEAGLTTNRIAAQAKVSIGTLYQYFPTKESIVTELLARNRSTVAIGLSDLFDRYERDGTGLETVAREVIEFFIGAYCGSPDNEMRNAVIRLGWLYTDDETVATVARSISERVGLFIVNAQTRFRGLELNYQPVTLFVASRAMLGILRSASIEKSSLIGTAALRDELLFLMLTLFGVRR